MKFRLGACALLIAVTGCSGGDPAGTSAQADVLATARKESVRLAAGVSAARSVPTAVANAPDRGALVSYQRDSRTVFEDGAYTWYPANLSEAHALNGIASGSISVPAPDGSQVKLRYERHVEEADGNWTWIGRVIDGDQRQEAIITFGEKAVFGSIPQLGGRPALSLQTRNGSLWVVEADPSRLVKGGNGHADMMVPEAAALRSSVVAASATYQAAQIVQGAVASSAVAQAATPTASNTIDVAIGYTPEFATANGGASGAVTRLTYLIQVSNQAFVNSDINGYLRIVNATQVSYTNVNTNQAALSELTGSNGQTPVTVPAALAPLRTARDQYGADIAVLVRKFNTPENEGCGIAWLNGAGQTAITAADASWGYAVISDGYDQGTDGKTYYCADETLVHEAAHLMGSAHDRANSTTSSGGLQYGRYPYSFGYKTGANDGNFYTVMAYGDTGQLSHRIFSTPLKSTCGPAANRACGVANSEDNARSLNQTIPVVATFRATVVPFAGKGRHSDMNGNGTSDLFWRNADNTTLQYWLMNGNVVTSSASISIGSVWEVAHVGDTDGDGLADVIWINSGQLAVSRSTGSGFATAMISNARPSGWRVVGGGDINGDGKSDLVWRNADNTQMMYWAMDGTTVLSTGTISIGPWWTLSSVGDLNADGLADIVWVNGTQVAVSLSQSTGFNTLAVSTALPAGYRIMGGGDIDGDGRYDLVWRNADNTTTLVWLMNSNAVTSTRTLSIGPVWELGYVGDTGGDGLADLVWINPSQVAVSRSAGSSFETAMVSTARPSGQRLVNNK